MQDPEVLTKMNLEQEEKEGKREEEGKYVTHKDFLLKWVKEKSGVL